MSESPKTDADIFLPKQKEIKIFDRETKEVKSFFIEELVLCNRAKVLTVFSEILMEAIRSHKDLKNVSDDEAIKIFIEVAGEERLAKLYGSIIGAEPDWLKNNLTLKAEIELVGAFFEVNDIPFLMSQISKYTPKKTE
jgi:hypothetical protein